MTGYNKSKIDYGGVKEPESTGLFSPRAHAKDVLARYGSGNAGRYESYNAKRTSISGRQTGSYGAGLGRSAAPTRYGSSTNYGSMTNYGGSTKDKAAIRNVSAANENKKVGFGKEFPMSGFGSTAKKASVSDSTAAKVHESGSTEAVQDFATSGLEYKVGDNVSHVKFGEGVVKDIVSATKDYMVTVDFNDYGVKKMLAGFARLKKV